MRDREVVEVSLSSGGAQVHEATHQDCNVVLAQEGRLREWLFSRGGGCVILGLFIGITEGYSPTAPWMDAVAKVR